jgi:hypothetical protein
MRFEVLTVVNIMIMVLWEVMPYFGTQVPMFRRNLQAQSWKHKSETFESETSSGTLTYIYQTIEYHILEYWTVKSTITSQ